MVEHRLRWLPILNGAQQVVGLLSADQAAGLVDDWLALDIVCVPVAKPDHWQTLRRLLSTSGVAGNLTTDAHLAALAMTHDAVLVSCDRDFERFRGVRREDPLK